MNYYNDATGAIYNPNLTGVGGVPGVWVGPTGVPLPVQPSVAFGQQNWYRTLGKSTTNFAWALMGGVSVNISENAKLDLGYRYLNSGVYTSLPGVLTGAVKTSRITSQEVKLGIRYMID